MALIAFYANPERPEAKVLADRAGTWLTSHGHQSMAALRRRRVGGRRRCRAAGQPGRRRHPAPGRGCGRAQRAFPCSGSTSAGSAT